MKLIRTMEGDRRRRPSLAALEHRGGSALDNVLPAVKRIVIDVRPRETGRSSAMRRNLMGCPAPMSFA